MKNYILRKIKRLVMMGAKGLKIAVIQGATTPGITWLSALLQKTTTTLVDFYGSK
jgi:hypothetical protein